MSDRRTFLRGLAAATAGAAAITVPCRTARATSDPQIADLWHRHLVAQGRYSVASDAEDAALAKLPWWALPGKMYVNHLGEFCRGQAGWPAIQDYILPRKGIYVLIRPGERDITYRYECGKGPFGESAARRRYDIDMQALKTRLAARDAEEVRVGLPALRAACEAATDRVIDGEQAILALEPTSIDVAAAHVMLETIFAVCTDQTVETSSAMGIAAIALRGMLPHLTGELANDAAEFVETPDRPVSRMRASRGLA